MMIARAGRLRWKLSEDGGSPARDIARGLGAAAFALIGVLAVGATGRAILDAKTEAPATGAIVTVGGQIPSSDQWTERLSDPTAWRGGRYSGDRRSRRSPRPDEWPEEPEFDEDRPPERTGFNEHGTYRTVCVRLCDGSFFPISFATIPERFAHDAATCRSRCGSPARLYVYPNPGGEPEQMIDLEGRPYTALKSAFLFRTNYDAACTCKPQPWSQEALARHRAYADAQKKSGTRTVARTSRGDQLQADNGRAGPRERPDGAMLLGADQPSQSSRASKRAEPDQSSGNRRGGSYGRRNDWNSRAFGGF